jgi:biofilm PGA synthesis N-glycosyltransferase PgaC
MLSKSRRALLLPDQYLLNEQQNPLERFQALDFAGMMLFTAAALHTRTWPMANGANLAYTKEFFQTVGGFNNNHTYASGDDVFLMQQAFLHRPEQILFLKSNQAVVHTHTVSNWSDFIQQRIRWGTKNRTFLLSELSFYNCRRFSYQSIHRAFFFAYSFSAAIFSWLIYRTVCRENDQ